MIQPARRRMVNDSLIARNFRMATVLVWDHGLGQTLQESADLCNATGSPMVLLKRWGFPQLQVGIFHCEISMSPIFPEWRWRVEGEA